MKSHTGLCSSHTLYLLRGFCLYPMLLKYINFFSSRLIQRIEDFLIYIDKY